MDATRARRVGHFLIPLAPAGGNNASRPMQPAPEFRKQARQSAVRILLLEDESSFALLVRSYLGRANWGQTDLRTVETLEAALACLAAADYDLVIADLNVPDS